MRWWDLAEKVLVRLGADSGLFWFGRDTRTGWRSVGKSWVQRVGTDALVGGIHSGRGFEAGKMRCESAMLSEA